MELIFGFETLIRSQLPYLKQLALSYTQSKLTAEDLLQDTIVRIWSNQDKFTLGTNFKAWSSVVMRNVFINNCRKQKNQRNYSVYLDENIEDQKIENTAEQKIACDELLKEVNTLRDKYRRPIELYFEGFTYQEIAEDMHLSLGTVKSRIHCARGHLKQRLAC